MKNNIWFLVGPSCVGKTTMISYVEKSTDFIGVDLDVLLEDKFGGMDQYFVNGNWSLYLERQHEVLVEVIKYIFIYTEPVVIALPPSTFINDYRRDLCAANTDFVLNVKSKIICLLADEDLDQGVDVSIQRHKLRGYNIDVMEKSDRYIQESIFYRKLADEVICSNNDVEDTFARLMKIINNDN